MKKWIQSTSIHLQTINEKMDSIYINPFTDYPAEMGFYNYLELFDLIEIEEVECDDPDCDDPSHHH